MKIVWFLCFIFSQLSAQVSAQDDLFPAKNSIFISLGNNCWIAQALVGAELRECAFPFDWLFSQDDEGLNRALDEDFAYFTDKDCFSSDDYHPIAVRNNHYGMIFTHDWRFPDIEMTEERYNQYLSAIKVKYDRRIERFRKLQEYKGKVFFFRTFSTHPEIVGEYGWNTTKARKLKESLDHYFPNLDFTLVILSCSDPDIPEVDKIEGVIEFKIKELYNQKKYLEMFSQLINSSL